MHPFPILAGALTLLALSGPTATPPVRWGEDGHRMAARAAAETLPAGIPAFFTDAAEQLAYLFRAPVPEESIALLTDPAAALAPVDSLAAALASSPELTPETAATMLRGVRQTSGAEGRPFFLPIRAALTGRDRGPELDTIIPLLGGDEACRRLHAFAAALRGR